MATILHRRRRMELRRWWASARDSLWLVPAVFVVVSAALALLSLAVDARVPELPDEVPLLFGGGAEGARGLLSSIAGSMITVAGVTFSITVVALQLASSQFSPRVLRTFMRDRPSQLVLGSLIGAFTYAILVLRSIRGEDGDVAAFVPGVSVTGGILYALVALGMLVYFIHHIATRIQVSSMVEMIAGETVRQVERDWDDAPPEPGAPAADLPSDAPGTLPALRSGYLQLLDVGGLVALAAEHDVVLRLEVRPGAWVQAGAPLFSTWPGERATEDLSERVRDRVTVGPERSIEQDAAFGIRQLVDVAVKAISPSVNDPTTATDCIDRIGQILVAAGTRREPPAASRDAAGRVRLVVAHRGWDDLVGLAFDQLRQYGAGSADVSIAMAETIGSVLGVVPAVRHPSLIRQADRIRQAAADVRLPDDRARVLEAIDRALAVATG